MSKTVSSCASAVVFGLALAATAAQAMTVERVAGTVRVNKGTGFVTVTGSTEVRPGDSVMVDGKGKARLVYSDGCSVPVVAGSLASVGEVSPCSMTAQVNPPVQNSPFPFLPGLSGPEGALVTVGVLGAAGAGIGVAVSSSNNNGNNTARNLAILAAAQRPASP